MQKKYILIQVRTISGQICLNYNIHNLGYSYTKDCEYCSPQEHKKDDLKTTKKKQLII